jgi:predicted RNA-binding protein with PIN domain
MALARILVDGYSLLHSWPALAPGKTRHSSAAREELIGVLTQYRDACGTPITIVFDGAGSKREADETPSTPDVEVLYSRAGQTADQMIERAAFRLKDYGEVLVVTNDFAERDTVSSLGVMTSSCENFIHTVTGALDEMHRAVRHYNQQERDKYRSH